MGGQKEDRGDNTMPLYVDEQGNEFFSPEEISFTAVDSVERMHNDFISLIDGISNEMAAFLEARGQHEDTASKENVLSEGRSAVTTLTQDGSTALRRLLNWHLQGLLELERMARNAADQIGTAGR